MLEKLLRKYAHAAFEEKIAMVMLDKDPESKICKNALMINRGRRIGIEDCLLIAVGDYPVKKFITQKPRKVTFPDFLGKKWEFEF